MEGLQHQELLIAVVSDRIYLADDEFRSPSDSNFRIFRTPEQIKYLGYCDDFGPLNLASVLDFIELLEAELTLYPSQRIVLCPKPGKRNLTNAAFLLGAYKILVHRSPPEEVWQLFQGQCSFENYRDATYTTPDFGLTLLDCWRGLACGRALGWISASSDESRYDLEEYQHYDSPINGELHIVVPDKFVAFRGPSSATSDSDYVDRDGSRLFSARYYVDIFKDLGVSTIIRLNEPSYDKKIFEDAGFDYHDLEFEDCTSPPNDLVSRFMRIVDRSPGMIAVHCKAGLGRTGTLIALFLMLAHGFRARDAIGWLRIVRPGCVIGEQQHYLCQVEERLIASGKASAATVALPISVAPLSPGPADKYHKGDQTRRREQSQQVSEALLYRATGVSPDRVKRRHSSGQVGL